MHRKSLPPLDYCNVFAAIQYSSRMTWVSLTKCDQRNGRSSFATAERSLRVSFALVLIPLGTVAMQEIRDWHSHTCETRLNITRVFADRNNEDTWGSGFHKSGVSQSSRNAFAMFLVSSWGRMKYHWDAPVTAILMQADWFPFWCYAGINPHSPGIIMPNSTAPPWEMQSPGATPVLKHDAPEVMLGYLPHHLHKSSNLPFNETLGILQGCRVGKNNTALKNT